MKNRVLKYFSKGRWMQMATTYLSQADNIKKLLLKVKKYANKNGHKELKGNIKLLGGYVSDVATRRYTSHNKSALLLVVAGLIYFVTPTDFLPDFIIGGLVDDLTIVLYIIKTIEDELEQYKAHLNHLNLA